MAIELNQRRIDRHVDAVYRGARIDAEDLSALIGDLDWDDRPGQDEGGRFVHRGEVPTPTPEDLADAGTADAPGAIREWQQSWLKAQLEETSEEPWWGVHRLVASDGRDAFVAEIRSGYSFTGPSSDLVGIFLTRGDAIEAVRALGFISQFSTGTVDSSL